MGEVIITVIEALILESDVNCAGVGTLTGAWRTAREEGSGTQLQSKQIYFRFQGLGFISLVSVVGGCTAERNEVQTVLAGVFATSASGTAGMTNVRSLGDTGDFEYVRSIQAVVRAQDRARSHLTLAGNHSDSELGLLFSQNQA